MIEIERISKSFGGIRAVDNVSLRIEENLITSIIGPNGAGKTTLINLLTGFSHPDEGKLLLLGEEITRLPPYQITRMGIARTFQDLRLIRQVTTRENLLIAANNQNDEKLIHALFLNTPRRERELRNAADAILTFLGLNEYANQLAGQLSYGEQKLLTLGCCLATGANCLLLDEPVSGINPVTTKRILTLLRDLIKQKKTVVFIEHDIEAVKKVSDIVVVMDEGKLIATGRPDHVFADPTIAEAYLD